MNVKGNQHHSSQAQSHFKRRKHFNIYSKQQTNVCNWDTYRKVNKDRSQVINDQEKHLIQSFKKPEQLVVNKLTLNTYTVHYCMGYIMWCPHDINHQSAISLIGNGINHRCYGFNRCTETKHNWAWPTLKLTELWDLQRYYLSKPQSFFFNCWDFLKM